MDLKLLKGGHLSDRKCRQILELFCDDLTATHIADISGVSRVTVNNYLKLIRSAIASFCEGNSHLGQQTNIPENNAGEDKAQRDHAGYYGFSLYGGKVTASWLKGVCGVSLKQLFEKDKVGADGGYIPDFDRYDAVADFNDWRLYWLTGNKEDTVGAGILPEITGFWKHAKSRLQKFRGMNKNTLYLHIKECEFRYNFRNDDLLVVLNGIISSRHYLKNSINKNYISI